LIAHWRAPELLFSQTCSLPFNTKLADVTEIVGTPDYGLDGCPPGHDRSEIIVRKDAPNDATAVCQAVSVAIDPKPSKDRALLGLHGIIVPPP